MPYTDLLRGRASIPGHVYLVTTVTHERTPLFLEWQLGRLVVQVIRELQTERLAQTLAFVVMPDHVHWLLELGGRHSLSKLMRVMKGRGARLINQQRQAHSAVWQHGFHDHAVRDNESLVDVARYVIMNPVRAGLVVRIGDYPLWDAVWVRGSLMADSFWSG